jgi:hypothetical protein
VVLAVVYWLASDSSPHAAKGTGKGTKRIKPEPAGVGEPVPGPVEPVKPAFKAEEKQEWARLFNGKDLEGWKTHPDQPHGWAVEDGLLTGRSAEGNSHLFSERGDFGDFHLRAEARTNAVGNGGIYLRVPYQLVNGFPPGYEVQILHTHPNPNEPLTGSLYKQARFVERLVGEDEWFTLEVIARANRITVKVNGRVTADYFEPPNAGMPRQGHLALQAWRPAESVVQFRKIEVKELPPGQ